MKRVRGGGEGVAYRVVKKGEKLRGRGGGAGEKVGKSAFQANRHGCATVDGNVRGTFDI